MPDQDLGCITAEPGARSCPGRHPDEYALAVDPQGQRHGQRSWRGLPAERNLREGPLASERLLAALETTLADEPRRDVKTYIIEGSDIPLQADLLGPCFQLTWTGVPRWVRGFDTASYAAKRAIGVMPDGPAYRAGLRDGMALAGWAVNDGDITTPISITVRDGEVTRRIQYLPVDGSTDRLPTVDIAAKGLASPICLAWMERPP